MYALWDDLVDDVTTVNGRTPVYCAVCGHLALRRGPCEFACSSCGREVDESGQPFKQTVLLSAPDEVRALPAEETTPNKDGSHIHAKIPAPESWEGIGPIPSPWRELNAEARKAWREANAGPLLKVYKTQGGTALYNRYGIPKGSLGAFVIQLERQLGLLPYQQAAPTKPAPVSVPVLAAPPAVASQVAPKPAPSTPTETVEVLPGIVVSKKWLESEAENDLTFPPDDALATLIAIHAAAKDTLEHHEEMVQGMAPLVSGLRLTIEMMRKAGVTLPDYAVKGS